MKFFESQFLLYRYRPLREKKLDPKTRAGCDGRVTARLLAQRCHLGLQRQPEPMANRDTAEPLLSLTPPHDESAFDKRPPFKWKPSSTEPVTGCHPHWRPSLPDTRRCEREMRIKDVAPCQLLTACVHIEKQDPRLTPSPKCQMYGKGGPLCVEETSSSSCTRRHWLGFFLYLPY